MKQHMSGVTSDNMLLYFFFCDTIDDELNTK